MYFVGRLANYKYLNMDDAILNAIQAFERAYPGQTDASEHFSHNVQGATRAALQIVVVRPQFSMEWLREYVFSWCNSFQLSGETCDQSAAGHRYDFTEKHLMTRFTVFDRHENVADSSSEVNRLASDVHSLFGERTCQLEVVALRQPQVANSESANSEDGLLQFFTRASSRLTPVNIFLALNSATLEIPSLQQQSQKILAERDSLYHVPQCRWSFGERVQSLLDSICGRGSQTSSRCQLGSVGQYYRDTELDNQFKDSTSLVFSDNCLHHIMSVQLGQFAQLAQLPFLTDAR